MASVATSTFIPILISEARITEKLGKMAPRIIAEMIPTT